MLDIPVLISGGGPVGLTASLLLSQHGVRSLLVERHPAHGDDAEGARHQCPHHGNLPAMRHRRRDPRRRGCAEGGTGLIVWTETLAGKEIERRVPGRATAQEHGGDAGEELPLRAGRSRAGDSPLCRSSRPGALRFNTELTSFSQEPGGVTGTLTDRITGEETPFTARYLIAADGAQSRVRRALGVQMIGEEKVYDSVNILFEADLTQWVTHRPGRALFRRAGRSARHVPHHQRQGPLGLPDSQPQAIRLEAAGFHPGILRRTDPQGRRRARSARQGAGRQSVGSLGHRCRPLSRRRRFPGRRCRARDAADRRLWPEHRRAGRAQSGLEDRRRAARQGRRRAARQLSRRAPAVRPDHHPGTRWPTRCRWGARRGKATCCRAANSSTSRG